jgi:mannose-6-phosphate isomerase-like protein (cupin superfamily)
LAFAVLSLTAHTQSGATSAPGSPPPQETWWVLKGTPGQYGANRPHVKAADIKARHSGESTWADVVVDDDNFHAEYRSAAPGTTISPRLHPDTREFFAVLEGQLRVTLGGQPAPILATRGSIVNIPRKTLYSVEVIGTAPAVWVDANQQRFETLYPAAGPAPAPMAGRTTMKVALDMSPAPYTGNNRPHFNLLEAERDPKYHGGAVVQDEHMWAAFLCGYEKDLPAYDPADKGHFHADTAEWWVILQGHIRHNIETVGDFTSSEGDVVYAPTSTWHATRFAGSERSCRLAISTYQFTGLLETPQ